MLLTRKKGVRANGFPVLFVVKTLTAKWILFSYFVCCHVLTEKQREADKNLYNSQSSLILLGRLI